MSVVERWQRAVAKAKSDRDKKLDAKQNENTEQMNREVFGENWQDAESDGSEIDEGISDAEGWEDAQFTALGDLRF